MTGFTGSVAGGLVDRKSTFVGNAIDFCVQSSRCKVKSRNGELFLEFEDKVKTEFKVNDLARQREKRDITSKPGVDVRDEIAYFPDGSFYFRGQYFNSNCMPSFSATQSFVAPAFESCKNYYELKEVLQGMYLKPHLRSCPKDQIFDMKKSECVLVDDIPEDCYRDTAVCIHTPKEEPSVPVDDETKKNKTLGSIKKRYLKSIEIKPLPLRKRNATRKESDDPSNMGMFEDIFEFKGHLYNSKCKPLFSYGSSPYPKDCRFYYSVPYPGAKPRLMQCNSSFYDPKRSKCVKGPKPNDCYEKYECRKVSF